jgi:small subunit ribosomal protein S6
MAFYEHVLMVRPDLTTAQMETITKDFTTIIEDGGGKVTKSEYWGLRNTAYKIKKNRKAHYTLLNINSEHPAVAEMERQERLHEDVLRFMTIRVDALDDEPSIVMQAKSDRRPSRYEDRDRGGRS